MPLIECKCDKCGKIVQYLTPKEKIEQKCKCGGELKKLIAKPNFWIKV